MKKTILLTGSSGQVGYRIKEALKNNSSYNLISSHSNKKKTTDKNSIYIDLKDPNSIKMAIKKSTPSLVINPAAYTKVDQAEEEKTSICNQCI